MGNCFVTKLKSIVNNEDLPELNILKIKLNIPTDFPPAYYNRMVLQWNSSNNVVSVPNTKHLYTIEDQGDQGTYSEITNPHTIDLVPGFDTVNFLCAFGDSGEYYLKITNKYNLLRLDYISQYACLNLADTKYLPLLSLSSEMGSNVVGNLADVPASLTKFTFMECPNIYGNIADLGRCYNLTELNIWGTTPINVEGNIEDFVKAMVSGGVTSRTYTGTWMFAHTGIQYKGTDFPTDASVTFHWEPAETSGYTKIVINNDEEIISNS